MVIFSRACSEQQGMSITDIAWPIVNGGQAACELAHSRQGLILLLFGTLYLAIFPLTNTCDIF